jgi:ankyrin repeat protein
MAAKYGHESVLGLLLDTGGIDVNFKLRFKQTTLWRAAWGGHTAAAGLLLGSHNIDVDSKDGLFGQTPLSMAVEHGRVGIVKLLLETNSVDLFSEDLFGRTPLDLAVYKGHTATTKLPETNIGSQ